MALKSTTGNRWRFADAAAATAARNAANTAAGYPLACDAPNQARTIANAWGIVSGVTTDIHEIDGVTRPAGATRVNASGTSQGDRVVDLADQRPRKVFLLIGQSNAEGNSGAATLVAETDVSTDALQWTRIGTGLGADVPVSSWLATNVETGNEPMRNATYRTGEIGPWAAFERAYAASASYDAAYGHLLVPCAVSGTGFGDSRWIVGGDLYTTAVTRANQAMAAFPGSVFAGFLWHQGERDGTLNTPAATYEAALDAMIAGMRAAITGASSAPFVLGGIAPDAQAGHHVTIQASIEDTPNRVANCAYASSAGLSTHDGLHFTAASYRTLGARYYTALAALLPSDSAWVTTRADDSIFHLADIPFAGFVETTPPTTTTTSTATSGAEVTTAAGVAGRHVTVDPNTACGDITISADDVRITFGAGCTVGTIYLTNCDRVWLEGATSGTRVVSNAANGAGNLQTTYEATATHIACTDIDFLSDGEADNNNCLVAIAAATFRGCRFKSDGAIAVNFIGDMSDALFASCNFITGTGAESRWNIRNTATGNRRIVVLDCGFSNSASSYGLIRIGGTGWWVDGCSVNGGIEITMEVSHVADAIHITNNHIYRSTSFAGSGTMDDVNITGNTFYAAGWDADADITSNLSTATNLTVSGNTFLETDATLTTWSGPGDPSAVA